MDLEAIQSALREQQLDGWLFYDHHLRDPLAYRILGLDPSALVTRRWYYLIPAQGEPVKLVHRIEQSRLDSLPGSCFLYSSWRELESKLAHMLEPVQTLAMQYSPRNAIMYVSMVDAGTIELVREMGKTVVSSANLVSLFEATLDSEQIASHYAAGEKIDRILKNAWQEIGARLRPPRPLRASASITEHDVVVWLQNAMQHEGLIWQHGPNCSVNANSSNPHYEPEAATSSSIREGDFVLIDLWGRLDQDRSCFYDITWTAVAGREPSHREQQVFETVLAARDAAVEVIQSAFAAQRSIAGWQADDASREVIRTAGFGAYFTHRTGHSIATDLHGNGANLDNLETHDERLILPRTCFSVEPGIYLGDFGIRSEVNMITSTRAASVTGLAQKHMVRI